MNPVYPHKAIVLIGLKHSGKSTIAKLLAPFVGKTAFDTDDQVAELAAAELVGLGHTIEDPTNFQAINRQFYAVAGKPAFQALEEQVINQLIQNQSLTNYIVATGGGMMENQAALHDLKPQSIVVFLDVPEAVLLARILRGGVPPFLNAADPQTSFNKLSFLERTNLARTVADIEIHVHQQSVENVLALVLKTIKEHEHGRQ